MPFTCIYKYPGAAVKQRDATNPRTRCMYTDGGSNNDHVGASAIAPTLQLRNISTKRMEYTGKLNISNVSRGVSVLVA